MIRRRYSILRWTSPERAAKPIKRRHPVLTAAQFNQSIRDGQVTRAATGTVGINIRPKTTCDWCGNDHTIRRG